MEEEISIDMSRGKEFEAHPIHYTIAKEIRQRRKSYPSDPEYQKRKKWWIDHDFGKEAAAWAASWRLGSPRKTRSVRPGEEVAIENAILTAERRPKVIDALMRRFPEKYKTREDVITELDNKLRVIDYHRKLEAILILPDTLLSSRKIESNIFRDTSPD